METVESLKKELDHYKKKFSLGDHDLSVGGYLAYVELVRQQIDFIKEFKIKSNIDGKKSDTVLYDRAIALGESLPEMITKMNKLKTELNIQYDDSAGKTKQMPTSPQSIGKAV